MIRTTNPIPNPARILTLAAMLMAAGALTPSRAPAQEPPASAFASDVPAAASTYTPGADEPAAEAAAASSPVGWTVLIQTNHRIAGSAGLVTGAVDVVLQHVAAGDSLQVLTTGDTVDELYRGRVEKPQDVREVLAGRLRRLPYTAAGLRLGEALKAALHAAAADPARVHALVLVTDGDPLVHPDQEAEMRTLAAAATQWRVRPHTQIITIGVITEEERSHWVLHVLSQQLGGQTVLVRSSADAAVQKALQALDHWAVSMRRAGTPEPHRHDLWRWAAGILLLLGIAGAMLAIRRIGGGRGAPAPRPVENAEWLEAQAARPTGVTTSQLMVEALDPRTDQPARRWTFSPLQLEAADGQVSVGSGLEASILLSGPGLCREHLRIRVEPTLMEVKVAEGASAVIVGEEVTGPALRQLFSPSFLAVVGPHHLFITRSEVLNEAANLG